MSENTFEIVATSLGYSLEKDSDGSYVDSYLNAAYLINSKINTRTQSQCERVKQLELALHKLEVGSCKCLTKTNEYQYHAEFCPTRIIGEALNQLPPKVGE